MNINVAYNEKKKYCSVVAHVILELFDFMSYTRLYIQIFS